MKRIMYITQSNGGVARYLQMIFKYINKEKYEHILIYSNQFKKEEKDFKEIVDKVEFVNMRRRITIKGDFKALIGIYKLIKKYNPDLIYVHSSKAGALGRIANICFKKPIIYNPHGWSFNMQISSKKKLMFVFIERLLSRFCDVIIAISQKEKESALVNKICSDKKIKVIFNGIDIERYEQELLDEDNCRDELNIPKEAIVVGMVGRLSKQKAPDVFIKCAAIIKKKIPESFFLLVGDGEQKDEMEKLVEEYELNDCVRITGWVDNSYKYIKSFDVAMLLSRWEGFGLAIAEYMICEKPIVATKVDAIPNLIENNESGILVNPDNENEAAEAVVRIINDKEFTKYIVANARVKVRKEFDVKRVVKEHEKIIDELI